MIRPALPADADAIGTMHALTWAETYPGLVPQGLLDEMSDPALRRAAWAHNLARPLMRGGTLVAELDGRVVGVVTVCAARDAALGTDGELAGIYLLRNAQGRGLGTGLLEAGFGLLRARGFGSAGAWAVRGNDRAERFYAARGARPGATRTEHRGKHAIHETAWIWRDLAGWP